MRVAGEQLGRLRRGVARRWFALPVAGRQRIGAVAALAGDMLAMTEPYLTRYALARARVMIVPPVILVLAVWQSWAAGLVLLLAGPLIPVFMALVGLAAKEESRRQMTEIGGLNDLLVERLGAVLDIRVLGPAPCPVAKLQANYRFHFLLSAPELDPVRELWRELRPTLPQDRNVEFVIDVDPINLR